MLQGIGLKVVFRLSSLKWQLMAGVKDEVLTKEKAGVVYSLEWKVFEKVNISETRRSMMVRAKEHHAHACNGHPELSAEVQHSLEGHKMN